MTTLISVQKQYSAIAFLGRILLASIFLAAGLSKIPNWDFNLEYMSIHRIPVTVIALYLAIFTEVIGGVAVLIGFKTRLASMVLALYLIPVTAIFHPFWNYIGIERSFQLVNFMKNVSIIGGLFVVAAFGPGALSVDGRNSAYLRVPAPEKIKHDRAA